PQEVRDCLHEELAQALGPLNDLYRLPDSVFNDDNVHTVLTGFDMMILRAYYDPALRSGMTRGQVANALPGILSRINPGGTSTKARFLTRTPRAWNAAVQGALGPGRSSGQRQDAAYSAIKIAQSLGWQDHRRAFAHYAMGRALQSGDAEAAHEQYKMSDLFYARTPGTDLHRAYVATQLGAYSVSKGQGAEALRLIAPHIDTARRRENAALLSTLLLLRAEALELENRAAEAQAVRVDSLGWARYGFGSDWAVRAKMREIASLNPLK
ncbi:MAG TPA: ATP-dependent transcriptional regulator, partial [Sulfitobacter sp.]|nr:ATP-dependent transcriptional regulator [Sulfitobacter sp.]